MRGFGKPSFNVHGQGTGSHTAQGHYSAQWQSGGTLQRDKSGTPLLTTQHFRQAACPHWSNSLSEELCSPWKDLDRLERWRTIRSSTKISAFQMSEEQSKVQQRQGPAPGEEQPHIPSTGWGLWSSSVEKDLGVLVDNELFLSHQ